MLSPVNFWFLVTGYYTNTHAQDTETLTLLTYYPAPYGVYRELRVTAGTSGDAILTIEADTDNNNENDNPIISFLQDGGAANAFIALEGDAGTRSTNTLANAFVIGSEDNDPAIQFVTNDNVRMSIIPDGKIGIGTNSPGSDRLDIVTTVNSLSSGVAYLPVRIRKDSDNNGEGVGIGFTASTGSTNVGAKIVHERIGTYSRGDLAFYTKPTTGGSGDTTTEKMRITANGRVGIGTSNFLYASKLEVQDTTLHAIRGQSTSGIGIWGISTDSSGVYGSSTSQIGVSGFSTNYYGVYGNSTNNIGVFGLATTQEGVYGQSTNDYGVSGVSTWDPGVGGTSTNDHGVQGYSGASATSGKYDIYAAGPAPNYGPFTGGHDVKIKNYTTAIKPGMIVIATGEVVKRSDSFSDALVTVELSTSTMDDRTLGVFVADRILEDEHWYQPQKGERFGIVNALGEGLVWVTDINSPVENGDYITTSNIPGYGQKQDDDILHSYTLGKAVQNIDWDNITDTIEYNGKTYKKCLIAVTYHCG